MNSFTMLVQECLCTFQCRAELKYKCSNLNISERRYFCVLLPATNLRHPSHPPQGTCARESYGDAGEGSPSHPSAHHTTPSRTRTHPELQGTTYRAMEMQGKAPPRTLHTTPPHCGHAPTPVAHTCHTPPPTHSQNLHMENWACAVIHPSVATRHRAG